MVQVGFVYSRQHIYSRLVSFQERWILLRRFQEEDAGQNEDKGHIFTCFLSLLPCPTLASLYQCSFYISWSHITHRCLWSTRALHVNWLTKYWTMFKKPCFRYWIIMNCIVFSTLLKKQTSNKDPCHKCVCIFIVIREWKNYITVFLRSSCSCKRNEVIWVGHCSHMTLKHTKNLSGQMKPTHPIPPPYSSCLKEADLNSTYVNIH